MTASRRTFIQLGAMLLGSIKSLQVVACGESFSRVVSLEGHPATIGNESLRRYLDRELQTTKWKHDKNSVIGITVPKWPEGSTPFAVSVSGLPCSDISVFLERYLPYQGEKWTSQLENRDTRALAGRIHAKMLTLRYRVIVLQSPMAVLGGLSSRIRGHHSDARLIVAARTHQTNGRSRVFVRASTLIEEPQKHCGGVFAVDSDDAAERHASTGYVSLTDFKMPITLGRGSPVTVRVGLLEFNAGANARPYTAIPRYTAADRFAVHHPIDRPGGQTRWAEP